MTSGALRAHLGSRQVARVIYGAIIGLALIAALEKHPPAPGFMVGSLLATALAVALAEFYSEFVGIETRLRRRVERREVGHIADDAIAVAAGVGFPALFFVLAAAGAIENSTAFTLALWSGAGLIGMYGFAAARLAGGSVVRAVLHGVAVCLVGVLIIAIKALLH
jgi:hypothetical protein